MKNAIKKVFVLLLAVTFYGCQTTPFYVNQAMKAKQRGFAGTKPNLEPLWEDKVGILNFDEKSSLVRVNTPFANKFYREVETNLIDTGQEKQGYLVMTPTLKQQQGRCDANATGFIKFLCVISIIGIPAAIAMNSPCKSSIELEARILDKKGKLIKKYSAESMADAHKITNNRRVQIFYSTCGAPANCREKIQWISYENALTDILEQIHNDSAFLQKKLSQQSAN